MTQKHWDLLQVRALTRPQKGPMVLVEPPLQLCAQLTYKTPRTLPHNGFYCHNFSGGLELNQEDRRYLGLLAPFITNFSSSNLFTKPR